MSLQLSGLTYVNENRNVLV